jgi:hypothetical protein
MAGLSQMSIKMVESAGLQRRDVLFELKCDSIDSLFPWFDMPDNVQQLEREDCYWSRAFDPIIGQMPTYSCRQREYIAGLSRIVDTKSRLSIQKCYCILMFAGFKCCVVECDRVMKLTVSNGYSQNHSAIIHRINSSNPIRRR